MLPDLLQAQYAGEYKITLTYSDGTAGTIDLRDELSGPIFEPLKDFNIFKKFEIRSEFGTIEWENGADFSPEFLYRAVVESIKE